MFDPFLDLHLCLFKFFLGYKKVLLGIPMNSMPIRQMASKGLFTYLALNSKQSLSKAGSNEGTLKH